MMMTAATVCVYVCVCVSDYMFYFIIFSLF